MLFLSPLMNSTWLGPGSEIAQSLHRGRAISFFKDNPRRHPRNRQHWSHAYSRAETHQGLNGLNCRVRLFRHSKTNLGPDFLVRVTAFERRRMLIGESNCVHTTSENSLGKPGSRRSSLSER